MSETLTSRVGRLIAGGFHSIIDAVENAGPESVMEQAVRESESAIADVRTDLGTIEAQRHSPPNAWRKIAAVTIAFPIRRARRSRSSATIWRRRPSSVRSTSEAQLPILETRLTDLAEEKSKLEGYIIALQAKKREMRAALADFRKAREQQASPTGTATGLGRQGTSVQVRGERAAEAFDRIFQRQTGLPGTSGTLTRLAAKLAELEELTRRNRIAERLAQLKAGQA